MTRAAKSLPALLAVGLAGLVGPGCDSDARPGPSTDTAARPSNTEVSYTFDPGDKRQLVSNADNVFVGRVVRQSGQVSRPTSDAAVRVPQTQAEVRVITNIKGSLRGVVTVNQYGGSVDRVVEQGERRRLERGVDLWEGDPLLKAEETVLFATAHNPARDWHTIIAQPSADDRIRSPAEGRRLVDEFREARRAERSP